MYFFFCQQSPRWLHTVTYLYTAPLPGWCGGATGAGSLVRDGEAAEATNHTQGNPAIVFWNWPCPAFESARRETDQSTRGALQCVPSTFCQYHVQTYIYFYFQFLILGFDIWKLVYSHVHPCSLSGCDNLETQPMEEPMWNELQGKLCMCSRFEFLAPTVAFPMGFIAQVWMVSFRGHPVVLLMAILHIQF